MPTILLLDVSLSLCQPVLEDSGPNPKVVEENGEPLLRKNLAVMGCHQILDHFTQHMKLEFTSLIIFSSLYEILVKFTRDFELVKQALLNVEDFDKTNIEVGLIGVSQLILEEWGNGTPCQIVLVTDGSLGTNAAALNRSLSMAALRTHENTNPTLPLPFPFPAKLNIVCITNPDDHSFKVSQPIYQKLLDLSGEGSLYVPEKSLSVKSSSDMFEKLIRENFMPYNGNLKCGHLSASVTLSPPPQQYFCQHDFEVVRESVRKEIEICGFLNVADVSSPPAFSRHLVLSVVTEADLIAYAKDTVADEDRDVIDEGLMPAFCVLLHGGLKREKMVALCQVGNNWYGMLYAWADKKKSNLMMSIFRPGTNAIPWIGKLSNLGPANLLDANPYGAAFNTTPFPLKVVEKKSYAQNCVVWVRQGGLQSDIQKILRHARKLPEKHSSFYKELNRVRKAAYMYGFPELLTGLASLLEKECYNLPAHTHPEASIQLQHTADSLRQWEKRDPKQNIVHYKGTD